MIESLASLATRIGSAVGAWIESAYVLDCTDAEGGAEHDLAWLPALSGVTVASAQAIQSHARRVHPEPW
ncbi:hypothetical protein J2Y66_000688 [Paenarthrobacter nitroguajacolicus]|uniref:hypothetical protein n=1 Tax=Paenarthrobacter TaxID=1742992 RepID=UPI0028573994|nr:hypothetical protein [Paenarthrobacter nitroguajacolicus]MDR6986225.1 hypothetical protein [Paenarthrobacter nitroguajacolicus]